MMHRTFPVLVLLTLTLALTSFACEDFNWHGGDETQPECEAEETGCDGTWTKICNSGLWERQTDCSVGDKVCDDGVCVNSIIDGDLLFDGDVDNTTTDGDSSIDGDSLIDGDQLMDGDNNSADGDNYSDGDTDPGLTWVLIPGGMYKMGCVPQDTKCSNSEKPQHPVTVSTFDLTETVITQDQYYAVTGKRPSYFTGCGGDCPVENVDWYEAKAFCAAVGGRLPSEAEWEYAARGRTTTIYYCGNDSSCLSEIAWYSNSYYNETHPVKTKDPNDFGLYDMLGNVWEWTEDCWHNDYTGAPSYGGIWAGGNSSYRVLRGGWWFFIYDYFLRASNRLDGAPDYGYSDVGFRCSRD